jgi:predicted phage terminase large subunit-like protein
MITYLRSRNRNADAERYHKASLCMATNPHCDSFLKDWVWWWLDPETGIPDPDKRGVTRYFVKQRDGSLDWYATRKEAEAVYGSEEDSGITSMCVIGSTVYDNPYISKAYIGKLKEQSRVEQDRLLYGSWTAREESAGYFKKEWLEKITHPNVKATQRVRAWDLAASEPSEKYKDPDWTAGVLFSKDKDKILVIEDVVRFRKKFLGMEEKVIQTAEKDGRDVVITLPLDAGAGGNSYAKTLQAKLAERGFTVKLIKPKLNKVLRFGPFASMAEAGYIKYVTDDGRPLEEKWNEVYLQELEKFDGGRKGHDDMVDATSDGFNYIRTAVVIPNFRISSFTQENKFHRD